MVLQAESVTVQLRFSEIEKALKWYESIFGRKAHHIADPTFHEWEVFPNYWIQICEGDPIKNGARIRFGVQDLEKTKSNLQTNLRIKFEPILIIPNSVALYNFSDPWRNPLGIFQDLQLYPFNP